MPSSDPTFMYYGSGRLECYWTGTDFRGWNPISAGGAGPEGYSPKLTTWGF